MSTPTINPPSTAPTDPVADVLEQVRSWPAAQRIALAQGLLGTVRDELAAPASPRPSLRNLVGRLSTEGPPPSDEECRQILEDELIRKHLR